MAPNGAFRIQFAGVADTPYVLEASSDLREWIEISNPDQSIGGVHVLDQDAVNFPLRFYRIREAIAAP